MYEIKILVTHVLKMLLLALPLFLGTFLFAVSILIIYHYEFKNLKQVITSNKGPLITELPIITKNGEILNSVEDLDMYVDILKAQVEEKNKELETSKSKLLATEENLKKLNDTTNEVKKYYLKLKAEIAKNEKDCKEISDQIDDFFERQLRLKSEVTENVKFYTNLLSNIENSTDVTQDIGRDFEVVGSTDSKKHLKMNCQDNKINLKL